MRRRRTFAEAATETKELPQNKVVRESYDQRDDGGGYEE